jgi:hypothetical protein
MAAIETPVTVAVFVGVSFVFRLRFAFENSVQGLPASQFGVQVSHNGGSFNPVWAASSFVQGAVSTYLTDGAATTQQLFGSGVFTSEPAVSNNVNATTGEFGTFAVGDCTEAEWMLEVPANSVAAGDTLDFQLTCTTESTINQYGTNVRLMIGSLVQRESLDKSPFYLGCMGVWNL